MARQLLPAPAQQQALGILRNGQHAIGNGDTLQISKGEYMAALQRAAATGSVAGTALLFESNLNADLLNQIAANQALHSFASTAPAPAPAPGAEAAYLGSFSQLNGQPLQSPLPPLPQNLPFGGGFNAHPYNNSQAPAHPAQTMHGFSAATASIDEFRAMVFCRFLLKWRRKLKLPPRAGR
jgi:hypothetical protein